MNPLPTDEPALNNALRALRRCRRGGVSTEYLMLVAVMGLTLAATLTALAPGSVLGWSNARRVLYGRAP